MRRRRRWNRLAERPLTVLAVGVLVIGVLATVARSPRPHWVWNGSASSPKGLYVVAGRAAIEPGDWVVAWAPAKDRRLAAERHYLPLNTPLVKRVVAAGGQQVCAHRSTISIDQRPVAERRRRDRFGRLLPWWSGCRRLRAGELFLLSTNQPLAFDGRYFGVTSPGLVVGKARLIWSF